MKSTENYIGKVIDLLVDHSCEAKEGDAVLIECIDIPQNVVADVVSRLFSSGLIPIISQKSNLQLQAFAKHASEEAHKMIAENELFMMKKVRHFIGLRAPESYDSFSEVSNQQMKKLLDGYIQPVHYEYRNKHLNWVYVRLATEEMARRAKMTREEFESYYYRAILVDYDHLEARMKPLEELLLSTREVRIQGPGYTDLYFHLDRFGAYSSSGKHNLPDGEVFTAPVRSSVNGLIQFNVDSFYYGNNFHAVNLEFRDGKAVNAHAGPDTRRLNELLDMDEGARYIGEFAIGVNPVVDKPINDILFDEKMNTSLHFALGNAYPVADNGNRSSIHWDLILDQSPSSGGGSIWFDGTLIRKNGVFIHPDILSLNP